VKGLRLELLGTIDLDPSLVTPSRNQAGRFVPKPSHVKGHVIPLIAHEQAPGHAGRHVGFAYLAYLGGVFAFLCDIIFNRARVTAEVLNALLNAVGSAVQVVPC
jgi:hypothetical protein